MTSLDCNSNFLVIHIHIYTHIYINATVAIVDIHMFICIYTHFSYNMHYSFFMSFFLICLLCSLCFCTMIFFVHSVTACFLCSKSIWLTNKKSKTFLILNAPPFHFIFLSFLRSSLPVSVSVVLPSLFVIHIGQMRLMLQYSSSLVFPMDIRIRQTSRSSYSH